MRLKRNTFKALLNREAAFQIILPSVFKKLKVKQNLLGDHSIVDPPDSMPNSEVKHNSADGSVGFPHVRVGHRQAPIYFHFLKSEDKKVSLPVYTCNNIYSVLIC